MDQVDRYSIVDASHGDGGIRAASSTVRLTFDKAIVTLNISHWQGATEDLSLAAATIGKLEQADAYVVELLEALAAKPLTAAQAQAIFAWAYPEPSQPKRLQLKDVVESTGGDVSRFAETEARWCRNCGAPTGSVFRARCLGRCRGSGGKVPSGCPPPPGALTRSLPRKGVAAFHGFRDTVATKEGSDRFFDTPAGPSTSPRHSNAFVYLGPQRGRFRALFRPTGAVVSRAGPACAELRALLEPQVRPLRAPAEA